MTGTNTGPATFTLTGDQVAIDPFVVIVDTPERGLRVERAGESFGKDVTFRVTYEGPSPTPNEMNWESRITKIEAFDADGNGIFSAAVSADIHGGMSVGDDYLKFTINDGLPGYEGKTVMITNKSFSEMPVTLKTGNEAFDLDGLNRPVPCFTADCLVFDADWNEIRVGDLKEGDLVRTADGAKAIRGVFSRQTSDPKQAPVSVMGQRFSPQHRIRVSLALAGGAPEARWMKAKFLGETAEGCAADEHREGGSLKFTTYIHLLTDAHSVILGPVVDSESLLVTERSLALRPRRARSDRRGHRAARPRPRRAGRPGHARGEARRAGLGLLLALRDEKRLAV